MPSQATTSGFLNIICTSVFSRLVRKLFSGGVAVYWSPDVVCVTPVVRRAPQERSWDTQPPFLQGTGKSFWGSCINSPRSCCKFSLLNDGGMLFPKANYSGEAWMKAMQPAEAMEKLIQISVISSASKLWFKCWKGQILIVRRRNRFSFSVELASSGCTEKSVKTSNI